MFKKNLKKWDMEDIYADLEKIICSKVEEFNSFLLQFQQEVTRKDLQSIIEKKNELLAHCTDYVYKKYPSDDKVYALNGQIANSEKSLIHFHSINYMYDRAKELDEIFLEFLDKFIDWQVKNE